MSPQKGLAAGELVGWTKVWSTDQLTEDGASLRGAGLCCSGQERGPLCVGV